MRRGFVLGLLAIAVVAPVRSETAPPQNLKAAYAMQQAVVRDQDLAKIESLLKAGFPVDGGIGCGGYTALDGAVDEKNPAMAELLLRYGAKPTPRNLVDAAFIANQTVAIDLVKRFLAAGVDFNASEHAGGPQTQWRALDNAVWRQNGDLVKLLLAQKGIELNYVNGDGYTPLMIAVEKGGRGIVQALLLAGADPLLPTPGHETALTVGDRQLQNARDIRQFLETRTAAAP
jgi:ankyrin repeat protein